MSQIVSEGDISGGLPYKTYVGLQMAAPKLVYIDPPFFSQRNYGEFDDRWENKNEYADEIALRVRASLNYLTDNANIVVHVDWRGAPDIRARLDDMLTLQNEIIWKYNSGGASKRRLARKHDTLLWYTTGDDYTFNIQREPYPHDYGNMKGMHPDGKMLSDVWTDIGFIGTSSGERTGYPTQKPVKLLNRIVTMLSNEGDNVLDFYCGAGTTGVSAKNLNRGYVLIDRNPEAIRITKERLDAE